MVREQGLKGGDPVSRVYGWTKAEQNKKVIYADTSREVLVVGTEHYRFLIVYGVICIPKDNNVPSYTYR